MKKYQYEVEMSSERLRMGWPTADKSTDITEGHLLNNLKMRFHYKV